MLLDCACNQVFCRVGVAAVITTLDERETTVRWDARERIAHIWTNDPYYIRKLKKLCETEPDVYTLVAEREDGCKFDAPSKFIGFRKPRQQRELSVEEIEARRKHLQEMRAIKAGKLHPTQEEI